MKNCEKYTLICSKPKPNQPKVLGRYKTLQQAESALGIFQRRNAEHRMKALADKSQKLGILYFGLKLLEPGVNF
jgi:hypothetical protein